MREQERILNPDLTANGDFQSEITFSRRRRRQELSAKPPLPKSDKIPVITSANGETHFPADIVEMKKMRSRLTSEKKLQSPCEINTELPQSKTSCADEAMSNDKKLLYMDMLYSNHAVASQQAESDEGSDETTLTKDSSKDVASVNVKALAERLQNCTALPNGKISHTKNKTEEQSTSTIATAELLPPSACKKDSDVMWEKLMMRENHVS